MKNFITFLLMFRAQQSLALDIAQSGIVKAIIPTSRGQIGVNPVTDLATESVKNIGPHTQWYQTQDSTTKWIGVNTEYLTDLTVATTVNGQPTQTAVPAAIVATTATADANGVKPGDVSVAFSPKLVDVLSKLLSEAEAACGRKRQTCDVDVTFAQRVAEEARAGGVLEFVDAGVGTTLPVITAGAVSTILNNAGLALPLVGLAVYWSRVGGKVPVVTVPAAWMDKNTGGDEDKDQCPADAPKGDEAVSLESGHDEGNPKSNKHKPLCTDNECKAENKSGQKCKEGKYKGCSCLASAEIVGVYTSDETIYDYGLSWLDLQQRIIQDLSTSAAPQCSEPSERWFSYKDGFDTVTSFCDQPDRKLKLRPSGDGLPDAQISYNHATLDPTIRVYAYVDDECKDKPEITMSKEDCHKALDGILNDCDKDSEDKKMGGSAAVNCQWFNIAAIKGPITVPGHQDPNPPPREEKLLSVVLSNFVDESHYTDVWYFHVTKGEESAVCRPDDKAISSVRLENKPDIENPPWPGGTFPLKIDGLGDCNYKNDGSNPGALWCGDQAFSCQADDSKTGPSKVCDSKYFKTSEHAVVKCKL